MNRLKILKPRPLLGLVFLFTFGCVEMQRQSSDADFYFNRGISFCQKGQFEKAISDYTKAIMINPKHDKAYCNRGNTYVQAKKQYEQAINDYTKAIEINPRYSEAYSNRGVAFLCCGQIDKCIVDCTKAIELNPMYAEAYCNAGIVYEKPQKNSYYIGN